MNYYAMPLFLYLNSGITSWRGLNASERATMYAGPFLLICTARLLYAVPYELSGKDKLEVRRDTEGYSIKMDVLRMKHVQSSAKVCLR